METGTGELLAAQPPDATELSGGLIEDVLHAVEDDHSTFERAAAFGDEWHRRGGELGGLARELGRLGVAVEDRLIETPEGLSPERRRRLREVMIEATACSLEAYAEAKRVRRDRWLSYHAHEMRNALNTLVNAQWILKNSEGKNNMRVLDMAERAVRRLENAVKEVRELETQSRQPAPGRPDRA